MACFGSKTLTFIHSELFPALPLSLLIFLDQWAYLQTDRYVHPAAEGGAHSSRWKPQVFEDLREGLSEGYAGPFLCYHHAGTHTGQVHISQLDMGEKKISISKTYELESDKIILVFAEKRRKIVSVF